MIVGVYCMCHNVVSSDLSPVRTVSPLYDTSMLLLVTVAVHPASHNCPIEINECVLSSGTTCVNVAAGGSAGISRCPSCVDVMVFPSGIVIVIGDVVIFRSTNGVSGVHICTVHPVSSIILVSVGGPKLCDDVL